MTKLKIVGTERGGDGKSTLAVVLAGMEEAAGHAITIIDGDDAGRLDAAGVVSRLGQVLKNQEVVWIGAGPDAAAVEANSDALSAHWDKVGKIAAARDCILDLGANTVQKLIEYAGVMNIGARWAKRGIEIECWIPFSCEDESFSKGVKTVRRLHETIPGAKIIAVKNGVDGELWKGKPEDKELTALEKAGVVVVSMPKCGAPPAMWDAIKAAKLSPFEVVAMDEVDLAKILGLSKDDTDPAERARVKVEQWLAALYKSFKGLVPEGVPGK